MAETAPSSVSPWLRWLIGLALPSLVLGGLGLAVFYWEQRTQWGARRLGDYLLERNADRAARGSVWQGILATRQTRSQLQESPARPAHETSSLPRPILQNRYWEARRSDNFLVLSIHRRAAPLKPSQLSAQQVQELARSLLVYQKGKQLLASLTLPPEPFLAHARIRAQIALEDNTLFPLLHQRLLAGDIPAAWDFVEMADDDLLYWKERLAPLLAPAAEGDRQSPGVEAEGRLPGVEAEGRPSSAATDQIPQVVEALHSLVQTWADSLRLAEIQQLQKAWETGPRFQLRIAREMDTFTGYAILAEETPVSFEIPPHQGAELLDLPPPTEPEP